MKKIGLRFAIALLVLLGAVSAAQAQPPTIVYKWSRIPPAVVFREGFRGEGSMFDVDLGLHVQQMGEGGYVSTTSDETLALALAQAYGETTATAPGGGGSYWVYIITLGPGFVDVAATFDRTVASLNPSAPQNHAILQDLQMARPSFTNYHEYASHLIDPSLIRGATQYNSLNNTVQRDIANLPGLMANIPAVPPYGSGPLGTVRGIYYLYAPPYDDGLIGLAGLGVPQGGVPGGLVCGWPWAGERGKRSTDATAGNEAGDCGNMTATVAATIPLNTPAVFSAIQNNTSNVYPGNYRQWVDVDGDGLTDLCVLYVASPSYIRCYRNATSTNPNAAPQGIFNNVMLVGNITDGSGVSGTWSFVNVTGKLEDIAFCRVLSNNTLHCDNFAKSTTVAVTPTQIDSDPIEGGYTGGGQWVHNVLGDGMPGFCINTPTQTIRNQPVFSVGCMVSTGSGFAARLDALVGDSPVPGSQRWVDVLGDGTKAFCWQSANHFQVSCLTVEKDSQHFETPINSGQVQVGSYGQDETWWEDVNGDGKADYCRAVVDDNNNNHIVCTLMGQSGFGTTFSTPPLKLGYAGTGAMVDINGDGYADFCRLTKASNPADPTKPVQMSCLINDHENFLTSIDGSSSYNIELNLELTNPGVMRDESVQTGDLAWLTGSGRQIGQYCRVRNDYNLACTGIY